MSELKVHPLVARLEELAKREDRGALAALRRGLGQRPGTAAEMYRYVEPYLGEKRSRAEENAAYLVAAFFGLHPASAGQGNLGSHLAACKSEGGDDALERRFTALLSAHSEDLGDYLRQAVSYLKSKNVAIHWNQLYWDIRNWDADDRKVQKHWASAFWGPGEKSETNNQ